ncbi:MAG TPA: hypothetical protein VGM88_09840 [Kofleriaceae bacterium]|jgi:hypothetical protein
MRRFEQGEGEEILRQELVDAWVDKKQVRGEIVVTSWRVLLRVGEPKRMWRWQNMLPFLLQRVVDQTFDLPVSVTAEIERDDFESAEVEGKLLYVRSRGTGYAATYFTAQTSLAVELSAFLRRWAAGEDPRVPGPDVPGATLVKR